jgi:hypothetical protein
MMRHNLRPGDRPRRDGVRRFWRRAIAQHRDIALPGERATGTRGEIGERRVAAPVRTWVLRDIRSVVS